MESHAGRKEILEALTGKVGESTRWSRTVSRDMKYVALPVGDPKAPLGVVRVSMAVRNIAARTQLARKLIWELAMTLAVAAVCWRWARPALESPDLAQHVHGRSLSVGDCQLGLTCGGR
jgi:two-component system phosphate regulon sensor histidine kinase PhoR